MGLGGGGRGQACFGGRARRAQREGSAAEMQAPPCGRQARPAPRLSPPPSSRPAPRPPAATGSSAGAGAWGPPAPRRRWPASTGPWHPRQLVRARERAGGAAGRGPRRRMRARAPRGARPACLPSAQHLAQPPPSRPSPLVHQAARRPSASACRPTSGPSCRCLGGEGGKPLPSGPATAVRTCACLPCCQHPRASCSAHPMEGACAASWGPAARRELC